MLDDIRKLEKFKYDCGWTWLTSAASNGSLT